MLRFLIVQLALAAGVLPQAFAQSAPSATGQPPMYMNLILFGGMFAIIYMFMIRPQVKKQKDHQEFVSKLERGTEVITSSGILGRIEGLTDSYVTLEIAQNVRIKVLRSAISGLAKNAAPARTTAGAQEVKP